MSSGVEGVELEERKSDDKQEIADEEREKMLNEVNKAREPADDDKAEGLREVIAVQEKKQEGEVEKMKKVLEETEKEKEKQGIRMKIPIGGIKMPGFLRSRSKEKANKDAEVGDVDEGADLLAAETPCVAVNVGGEEPAAGDADKKKEGRRLPSIKITNPFARKPKEAAVMEPGENTPAAGEVEAENEAVKEKENKGSGGKRLLDAIRLPLVSVFPRKLKSKEPGAAGLASIETLDDSGGGNEKASNGDGMESVKLYPVDLFVAEKADLEKGTASEDEGKQSLVERLVQLSKWKLIIGGVVLFLLLLLAIVLLAVFGPRRALQSAPLVDGRYVNAVTSCGLVQGVLEDGAFAFRGVPYARAPEGDRRWLPAEPLDKLESCWNGTLYAHNATATCWQLFQKGTVDGAEDCLTLEIFTPHVRYDNPLPVVVLIGAESFNGDSPGVLRASPKLSRAKDVIFVRPNFRLGIAGFLVAKSLTEATHPPTSGNYALHDIIAALNWIQLNIDHFGGNPNSVTLLGHRAGATLVTVLTSSKAATKLFAKAWVSSGSAIFPGKELPDSEAANSEYLNSLSCSKSENEAECLREMDIEELLDAVPNSWRRHDQDLPRDEEKPQERHEWLVKDGNILRDHLVGVWSTDGIPVKLVIGTTAHADASQELRNQYPDEDTIAKHVRSGQLNSSGLAEEALRRYGSTWAGLVRMISDIRTVCPLLAIATAQSSVPFYVVNQTRDIGMGNLADVGADVAAILGRYEPKTSEQRRYVAAMQQLFYQFVWHGELKKEEADKKNNYNRVLIIGQDTIPNDSYANCDFWIQKDIVPRYGRID